MIGPYNENLVRTEVEIEEPVENVFRDAIEALKGQGIRVSLHYIELLNLIINCFLIVQVIYGHWLIDGYPKVLLIDIGSAAWKLDEWKHNFWEVCNIGTPHHDRESNDAIIFGYIVAWFLGEFYNNVEKERGKPLLVAHFHEWLAGIGLILCRTRHLDIATVFTTHATLLGRYLCAANLDFYNNLDKVK